MFLIALIAVGIFIYYKGIPDICNIRSQYQTHFLDFEMLDYKFTGSNSAELPNNFFLVLQGKKNQKVTIKNVSIFQEGSFCGDAYIKTWFSVDENSNVLVGGNLSQECTRPANSCFKYSVEISFDPGTGKTLKNIGKLTGTFEEQERLYSMTPWYRTNFSGEILQTENGQLLGSYSGSCPAVAQLPTNIILANQTLERWSKPTGCNTGSSGGNTGKGFTNTTCIKTAQYLAHGWLTNNITLDEIYAGHKIYLSGEAQYTDLQGNARNDGICINDNFYFYVNGIKIAQGGTTGITDSDNVLEPGEEVLRLCNGCYDIDSSGWCIPPVELSASSAFKFDKSNEIMILVEDYCKGGGQTYAGGLKPFKIYII